MTETTAANETAATGYRIRPARRRELALLPAIEREAGRRFQEILELDAVPEDLTPPEELDAAHARGLVWVAEAPGGELAGFAYGAAVDGALHLEEVDVLPTHGRRGLGTALVRAACRDAAAAGFAAVTLATFRNVPWNAPWYARLGFRVVPPAELSPGLARAFQDEARRGLPLELRVVMRLELTPGPE
ncbi:MAG TPA: GNAT family N-acetyltransferase [Thermoanaerobaculia bacterium]|jgi:predicted N-acetyltransferase YhbS